MDVGQPVVERKEIFAQHTFGRGQVAMTNIVEQFQPRHSLKDFTEVLVLMAIFQAIFHGHHYPPFLAVLHEDRQHLPVEFVPFLVAQIGGPAHKMHGTNRCAQDLRHVDGAA